MDATQNEGAVTMSNADVAGALSEVLDEELDENQGQNAETSEAKKSVKAEEGETEENEEGEAPETYEVKINGETQQVTLDELRAGYQNAKASTQRYEEAAKRTRFADDMAAQAHAQRETSFNRLQQLEDFMLSAVNSGLPNQEYLLQQGRTEEYLQAKHAMEKRDEAIRAVQAERQRISEEQAFADQEAHARRLEDENSMLMQAIPEWTDSDKRDAGQRELSNYLQRQGFDGPAIDSIIDHREIVLARKAMFYDQHQAALAKAKQKAAKTPPPKAETPSAGGDPGRGADGMKRLEQEGSVEAAAAVMSEIFKEGD